MAPVFDIIQELKDGQRRRRVLGVCDAQDAGVMLGKGADAYIKRRII